MIDRMIRSATKRNPLLVNGKSAPEVRYTRVRARRQNLHRAQARDFGLIDGIEDLPTAVRSTPPPVPG